MHRGIEAKLLSFILVRFVKQVQNEVTSLPSELLFLRQLPTPAIPNQGGRCIIPSLRTAKLIRNRIIAIANGGQEGRRSS